MAAFGWLVRVEPIRMRWRKRSRWIPQEVTRFHLSWGCKALECWYFPGRGLHPWRIWHLDFPGCPSVVFPFVSTAVRKRKAASAPQPGDGPMHLAPIMTKSMQQFPNLVMFCSVVRYDDGDPRQTGWIQIRTDGSAWKVILKDTDTCSQMTCLGNTLDDALALAELYAGADDAPWEPDPWAKRKGTGKK